MNGREQKKQKQNKLPKLLHSNTEKVHLKKNSTEPDNLETSDRMSCSFILQVSGEVKQQIGSSWAGLD